MGPVLTILFVLTVANSDMAVFYENYAFSILVLSTKKGYFSFLKKGFRFPEKIKALKRFKISNDCSIKSCRSLKWRAILKIPNRGF